MIEQFGTMPDGSPVYRVKLARDGFEANIITYGASLQDLRISSHAPSLVLGFAEFAPYLEYPYFGAFVGRVANRIGEGKFSIGKDVFHLDMNENARQTLHGGRRGLASKNWQVIEHSQTSVTLRATDLERENGFPGDCEIQVIYRIFSDQCLEMEISATTTKSTICNIAHHSYFNLNGSGTVFDHQLQIFADHYLPVDDNQIPTGEIATIDQTLFDFRKLKVLSKNDAKDIDHNFCLNTLDSAIIPVARLLGNQSGIEMEISTTETGLQVYTGKHLNTSTAGLNSGAYQPYSGIALEPQGWPDAPNQSHFPSVGLAVGQTYHQKTRFRFSKTEDA